MNQTGVWRGLAALSFVVAGFAAQAQSYPARPVTIVVPLAAGSGMDTLVRAYAEKLADALGKPVVIENKPGAALMLAAQTVATAPADGHTLLVSTSTAMAINPVLFQEGELRSPEVLRADRLLPQGAIHPGGELGNAGEVGTTLPLVRDGKLRALAVSSSNRMPSLPDVPPFGEAAGVNDFEVVSWHMLYAPASTPKDVVARLHGEMKKIMAAPDLRQKVLAVGLLPVDTPPLDGIDRFLSAEREKWGALVKSLGLAGTM
jgi:tripartite-type tricarboxylate transporter receptor subunit TctC